MSDRPHPLGLPTGPFVCHLRYLRRHYRLVPLDEAIELLAAGVVDEPTVVLRMDDGYGENFLNLRAALRAEPAPMTLFVCSWLIAESKPFRHDVRDGRKGFEPLTVEQVRALAAQGITIGGHTRTHLDCGTRERDRLVDEIAGSRQDLEAMLGREIRYFAFPIGHPGNMSLEAAEIAASEYRHYLSAHGGTNATGASQHLRRVAWPPGLWELELALQGVLEFGETASRRAVAPRVEGPAETNPPAMGCDPA